MGVNVESIPMIQEGNGPKLTPIPVVKVSDKLVTSQPFKGLTKTSTEPFEDGKCKLCGQSENAGDSEPTTESETDKSLSSTQDVILPWWQRYGAVSTGIASFASMCSLILAVFLCNTCAKHRTLMNRDWWQRLFQW